MHVVERLTRKGNALRYEVTVEDPEMMTKPWSPRPCTVLLGKPGEQLARATQPVWRVSGHGAAGEAQNCDVTVERIVRPML
jgi:hypothetical protein